MSSRSTNCLTHFSSAEPLAVRNLKRQRGPALLNTEMMSLKKTPIVSTIGLLQLFYLVAVDVEHIGFQQFGDIARLVDTQVLTLVAPPLPDKRFEMAADEQVNALAAETVLPRPVERNVELAERTELQIMFVESKEVVEERPVAGVEQVLGKPDFFQIEVKRARQGVGVAALDAALAPAIFFAIDRV